MEVAHEQQLQIDGEYIVRSDLSDPPLRCPAVKRRLSRRRPLSSVEGSETSGADGRSLKQLQLGEEESDRSETPEPSASKRLKSDATTPPLPILISRAFAQALTPAKINRQYSPSQVDVLSSHFEMEAVTHSQHSFPANPPYSHEKDRTCIIMWMEDIAESLDIPKDVVHSAAFQLDRIMSSTKIPKTKRGLVAACCLLLTCKYEGVRTHVPYACTIQRLAVMSNESPTSFLEMECLILNRLQWNLVVVSPCHFVDAFLIQGVVFEGDSYGGLPSRLTSLKDTLYGYCRFFADLCLKEYGFRHFKSSTVASAIIWASRRTATIRPTWRPELQALTMNPHSGTQFEACCDFLWKIKTAKFPDVDEDQSEATDGLSPDGVDAF